MWGDSGRRVLRRVNERVVIEHEIPGEDYRGEGYRDVIRDGSHD